MEELAQQKIESSQVRNINCGLAVMEYIALFALFFSLSYHIEVFK